MTPQAHHRRRGRFFAVPLRVVGHLHHGACTAIHLSPALRTLRAPLDRFAGEALIQIRCNFCTPRSLPYPGSQLLYNRVPRSPVPPVQLKPPHNEVSKNQDKKSELGPREENRGASCLRFGNESERTLHLYAAYATLPTRTMLLPRQPPTGKGIAVYPIGGIRDADSPVSMRVQVLYLLTNNYTVVRSSAPESNGCSTIVLSLGTTVHHSLHG
jgi:hypothetical protein